MCALSKRTYKYLFIQQECKCFYCGKRLRAKPQVSGPDYGGYTIDHLYPVSRGYNLNHGKVFSCRMCNFRKGNRMPTEQELKLYYAIVSEGKTYSKAKLELTKS